MNKILYKAKHIQTGYLNERKDESERIVFEFLKSFDAPKNICIFGAGNVARHLCKVLDENEKLEIVKAFIVSMQKENPNELNGIPVEKYTNYIYIRQKRY